jgi:hypothetical protein
MKYGIKIGILLNLSNVPNDLKTEINLQGTAGGLLKSSSFAI